VDVKFGTYDGSTVAVLCWGQAPKYFFLEPPCGSTCLETFLAGVQNFAVYFNWIKRDELFHLHVSLAYEAQQVSYYYGTS